MKNYFKPHEIFHNCTPDEKDYFLKNHLEDILSVLAIVNTIRYTIRLPIIVTSWCRDEQHNQRVGGVTNSQHKLGQAVDFTIKSPTSAKLRNIHNTIKSLCDKQIIQVGQCILYPERHFIHVSSPSNHINQFFEKK